MRICAVDSICAFSGKHDGVTADGGRSVPYAAKRGGRSGGRRGAAGKAAKLSSAARFWL